MISFQALNLSTAAVGTWLTIPLILLVNSGGFFGKKWIEENIDEGQLDKYFFLLAGIMIVNQVSLPSSQVVVTVTVTVTVTPHKPLHSLLDHPLLVVTGLMYYAKSTIACFVFPWTQQELAIGFEDKDRTISM